MKKTEIMEGLRSLIEQGTSPYHVTEVTECRFRENGYEQLHMNQPWSLEQGGKYYVNVQGSTLIVFSVGECADSAGSWRITAAHTDFPGFRLKQNAELRGNGYARLNVEVYGGPILNTWMDRPLSVSGRVALTGETAFCPKTCLVDLKKPLAVIPNLAVHLNREINKGKELNRQKELLPVVGTGGEELSDSFFRELLAEHLQVRPEEILDYELGLYNLDEPVDAGLKEELFSAPRIDNLSGVQAVTAGMLEGGTGGNVIRVAAYFDHEEIGSRTKQGAGSQLLSMILEKISLGLSGSRAQFLQSLSDATLLSVDVGHAFHPNYPEKMDLTNQSPLNQGLCIKEACSQSYATDSRMIAVLEQLCREEKISCTRFFNRSDASAGSTLGSIASAMVPVPTADIGIPILSMHSARELMGTEDEYALARLICAYYRL